MFHKKRAELIPTAPKTKKDRGPLEGPTVLGFSFADGEYLNQQDSKLLPAVIPAPPPKRVILKHVFHVYISCLFQGSVLILILYFEIRIFVKGLLC
jgi:hypothetical protein